MAGGMTTSGSDAFLRGWLDGYAVGRDDEAGGEPLREPPDAAMQWIRPGDKAVVRVSRATTPEQAVRLVEMLQERMPDVEVCVIAGVDGIDVYRPTEAGGPDGGERTGAEGPGQASAP